MKDEKNIFQRSRYMLFCILIGPGLFFTLWGFWPPERSAIEIPLQVTGPEWALPEERTLRLEFSPSPRAGDSQVVELRIVPSSDSLEANNLYEEYTVIAEARLDMSLAEVRPAGVVSAPLTEGGSATFYWEIRPRVEGDLDGTTWTYLRFVPREGGAEIRQAVAAQMVAIRPRSVLGRGGSEARFGGALGLVAGILLGGRAYIQNFKKR